MRNKNSAKQSSSNQSNQSIDPTAFLQWISQQAQPMVVAVVAAAMPVAAGRAVVERTSPRLAHWLVVASGFHPTEQTNGRINEEASSSERETKMVASCLGDKNAYIPRPRTPLWCAFLSVGVVCYH